MTTDDFDSYLNLCMSHTDFWDEDCEHCVESMKLCRGVHERVQSEVAELQNRLANQGAALEVASVLMLRFDTFLDMFLMNKQRAHYEHVFGLKMREQLVRFDGELAQMKLMEGMGGPPMGFKDMKKSGGKGGGQ